MSSMFAVIYTTRRTFRYSGLDLENYTWLVTLIYKK